MPGRQLDAPRADLDGKAHGLGIEPAEYFTGRDVFDALLVSLDCMVGEVEVSHCSALPNGQRATGGGQTDTLKGVSVSVRPPAFVRFLSGKCPSRVRSLVHPFAIDPYQNAFNEDFLFIKQ